MSGRTKEIILKAVIIIAFCALLSVIPGAFVYCWFLNEKVVNTLIIIGLSIFGVFAVILVILLHIWGSKQKTVKADKVFFPVSSYDDFVSNLYAALTSRGYDLKNSLCISSDGEVKVFENSSKRGSLKCYAIIRVPELSEALVEAANKGITQILGEKKMLHAIDMTSIFCVDRITPIFQKMVNSNMQQGLKNGRLIVGVPFGGKSIYIAKQKDGFAISKYRRMRSELIDIMELQNIN